MPGELFLSRRDGQVWAALRHDGRTIELHCERAVEQPQFGQIIKARVSKVVPGIQSAFLELGESRNGFLHATDLLLPGEVPEGLGEEPAPDAPPDPAPRLFKRRRAGRAAIQDRLKPGRDLLVQISREAVGSKGARVTCYLTLPGRLLVLFPQLGIRSVARRIEDETERQRLREITQRLPGESMGFVARTAAAGADEPALRADAQLLLERWQQIVKDVESLSAPALVYRELDLPLRLLRDLSSQAMERIVVDDREMFDRVREYLAAVGPELVGRVELYAEAEPLLDRYELSQDFDKATRPRVWLKSGGYLVIEQTEALVSIDVNTGKFLGVQRLEDTVLRTNLEAAVEIGRQLRLRDLGGIIVIDFIDMQTTDAQRQVTEALEQAMRADRARTKIVGFSELGLLQLTRKRTRVGLSGTLTRACPACSGQGRVKHADARLELMAAALKTASSAEWLARLDAAQVPCAPILSREEVLTNEQVVANELIVESDHPHAGRMRQPRPAARFESTPAQIRRPAPMLGEHTDMVLDELGLSVTEIASLRSDAVVA